MPAQDALWSAQEVRTQAEQVRGQITVFDALDALSVRVERKYHAQDGTVRSARVLVYSDTTAVEITLDVATGVVGWASDWTVDGAVLGYGTNHGPATYGHTDVVLLDPYLTMVRNAL